MTRRVTFAPNQLAMIRRYAGRSWTDKQIGDALGCGPRPVQDARIAMGLSKLAGARNRWSLAEIDRLRELAADGLTARAIGSRMQRTRSSVAGDRKSVV